MGVEVLYSSHFSPFSATGGAAAHPAAAPHACASPSITLDLVLEDGRAGRPAEAGASLDQRRARKRVAALPRSVSLGTGFWGKPAPKEVPSAAYLKRSGSRISEAGVCRASFSEDSGASGGEDAAEAARPSGDERAARSGAARGPSFGLGGPQADEFQWKPSPGFGEGFQLRIMALRSATEERRLSAAASDQSGGSRGPESVSAGRPTNPESNLNRFEAPRPSAGPEGAEAAGWASPSSATPVSAQSRANALCELRVGGVQLPTSIRKLKRRNSRVGAPAGGEPGCAIKKAFSSMVYMIKAMQSYAVHIRQALFSDWDVQEVLLLVHREMYSSFVWLFQQVFACTPKLMVSVMILLANFTVYSMGENVALAAAFETPPPIASILRNFPSEDTGAAEVTAAAKLSFAPSSSPNDVTGPMSFASGGAGGYTPRVAPVAGGADGDPWHGAPAEQSSMFSEKESTLDLSAPMVNPRGFQDLNRPTPMPAAATETVRPPPSDRELLKALLEEMARELELKQGEPLQHVLLDQETIRRLVAPVVTKLEPDNYACFDRTDLEYQQAISKEPGNPLLLANYAQFLYVVRHDNRAEEFFHRAMRADPQDADVLSRFASFLWLGRGDKLAAERAYKAAMAAQPENPFHAGSYAHFLWHAGDDEAPPRPLGGAPPTAA